MTADVRQARLQYDAMLGCKHSINRDTQRCERCNGTFGQIDAMRAHLRELAEREKVAA